MTVLQLSLKLVLFIVVGFVCRKLKVIADGFDKMLTRFVMAVPLPCMILNSFRIEYSPDNLIHVPILLALSVGSMAAMFLLVYLCTAKLRDRSMRQTIRFALLFTNFTFIGLPVVSEIYGPQGVFNYVIFTLPIRVMFYGGASVILGKRGEKIDAKETLRKFLCEPVIAVLLGFLLYVTQIRLPEILTSAISTLGAMATPLGLILCGIIIADADFRGILRHPSAIVVSVLRLTIVPAVAVALFLLVGVDRALIRNTMYFFAMPVASFTPTFLLRYDPDAVDARVTAGYMVVLSTLLCVATIPLWTMALEKLL
jgi:predicted permease